MEKNYVVCVKSPSDWPEIHNLLLQDGTLEDNIPSRSCACSDYKGIYADKATYLLDEGEAELLRNNSKVKYIELDPCFHPEAYPEKIEPDDFRFDDVVRIYKSTGIVLENTNFAPPTSGTITSAEENRTGWQLIRFRAKKDNWGQENYVSITGLESINRYFFPTLKELNPEYISGEDGSNTDCVVIDNGCWLGHPEFIDGDGISQVKDIILDGPYYIDKEYFDTNSKTTTYLGRTTCTEAAALEWWSDSTKRSEKFNFLGNVTGIGSDYTRAKVCGDESTYPSLAGTVSFFANHGTPCSSLMYGKTFGWAFNANKWNLAADIGFSGLLSISKAYEILTIFALNKPNSNLTILSNSYSPNAKVANEWEVGTYYYNFRGTIGSFEITTTGDKTPAPHFLKNFRNDNGSRYTTITSSSLDLDAGNVLVNIPGLIFFASAGNNNQKQVNPDDPDYNNYWSAVNPNSESFDAATDAKYVNRRGFPANLGYSINTREYAAISIGALSPTLNIDKKEVRDFYSNSGTTIDCFAPGAGTLAASGNSLTDTYDRYNSNAHDKPFDGTSAATPVAAGFIASKLTKLQSGPVPWQSINVKKYIKNILSPQSTDDFEVGTGEITSANSTGWVSYENIHGQSPVVLYQELIASLQFSKNLESEIEALQGESVTLSVELDNNYVDNYYYEWQVSTDFGQTFTRIDSEFSNSYTFTVSNLSSNNQYRCFVSSDGPYLSTYSSTTTINPAPPTSLIISTEPSSIQVQIGQYAGFFCKARTIPESDNVISYTWEKFSTNLNRWLKFLDETSSLLIFEQVQAYDAGRYRCKVTDSSSSNSPIYSKEVTLSTYTGVLNLTKDTAPVSLFVGQTLALEVNSSTNVRGIATLYSWEKSPDGQTDWESILGENNQKFSIASVRSGDRGYYRCVVSNAGADNSPVYSSAVEVDVKDVLINLTTTVPSSINIVEGKAFSIRINAPLNDLRLPSFTFEKKQGTDWIFYTVNNTGVLSFDRTPLSFAGTYRCRVSDYLAANSPVFTSEFTFTVSDSFSAGDISQSPASFTIGQTATLSANPIFNNADLRYSYQWQRQKAGESVWEDVVDGREKDLVFEQVRGEVYVDKFRCKISNNVGTEKISSEFSASFNPFVFVSENPQSEILFKKEIVQDGIDTVERTFALEPVIISTSPASVSYQWQISTDDQATWQDISGQTSSILELTEAEIIALHDGDFYLRLRSTLGGTSTYTDSTFINAKDRLKFFGNCFDQLGVDALSNICIDANILNPGDKCDDVNTCGISAAELVDKYPIYDFQKGVYNTWGGVEFPWEISNLVSNLDFAATDDKWNVSTYKAVIAYFAGDRAIFFEKDGKRLSLFEAKEDIPVGDPAYDFSKWARVCYIDTNVPIGFPTIAELKDRFDYYALEFYRENWGEFSEAWHKDLGDPDSDHWGNAKIKKDFFYRKGDVVLVDTVCEDALCVYSAIKDVPATQEVYDEYSTFKMGEYWQRIYCVSTGRNKCLERERKNNLSNYEVVEIGSKGHFVERPIPYSLDPKMPTLNEKAEQKLNPTVLTSREILDLDTETYPYTTECDT